jgi:hypothetical protein
MMLVTAGATDVTTYFHLRLAADGTDATGLTITNIDLQYTRSRETPTAKVDATALGAANSAHSDNTAIEIDATDQPGVYRVDWPDAAFASGVDEVILTVKCATAFTESLRVRLMSATRGLSGTALPNAAADAAGGLPISDAGGLDLDAQIGTKINDILTDTGTTLQGELDGIQADTEDIQTRLPAALVGGRIDATVDATGLEAGALALINTEVDTALTDIHLDHLLATTYDPASKPGAADALLNELVESDAGVARYTANALEQGPGGGSAPTAAEVADAVWDEAQADHVGAGSFGLIASEIADILVDTNELQTDWVNGGRLDLLLDATLADTNELQTDWANGGRLDLLIDAILADTNELQTDWVNGGRLDLILDARASQTSVDTIDDFLDSEIAAILAAVDTEVAAIKAKTDSLTYTVAGVVDANVQRINDVTIVGDGSGTPFNV